MIDQWPTLGQLKLDFFLRMMELLDILPKSQIYRCCHNDGGKLKQNRFLHYQKNS